MPKRESHPIPNGTNNMQIVWPFAFANAEKLGRSKNTHTSFTGISFFSGLFWALEVLLEALLPPVTISISGNRSGDLLKSKWSLAA